MSGADWNQQQDNEKRRHEEEMSTPKVYAAINAVQAAMATVGIGKERVNEQQRYKFRGIDDIYNALSRVLANNGLCILPRVTNRDSVERTNKSGTALFYTTLTVEFDFVCASDGSKHTVCTVGEAMDSGDKSANKAMSAAYKYACMQVFAIPTEGDNDADATTHEVAPRKAEAAEIVQQDPVEKRCQQWVDTMNGYKTAEDVKRLWANAASTFRQAGDSEAHAYVKAEVTRRLQELTQAA